MLICRTDWRYKEDRKAKQEMVQYRIKVSRTRLDWQLQRIKQEERGKEMNIRDTSKIQITEFGN